MPRKNKTAVSKTSSGEKKHTAVPPAVKPAVAKAVTPATPTKTEAAVAAAPTTPDTTAIKQLLPALRSVDADEAREAATALGALGDVAAVEPLIEIVRNLNGYFHAVVRSAAAASLGRLKDRRAFDALSNAIHDQIADSSSEAIRALAELGDRRQAVSTLIEVVRNRDGFFVDSVRLRAAVLGLIKLGGDEAQAELRLVSSNGWEDSVIREEATAAVKA